MTNTMKKLIVCLLAVLMIGVTLAACKTEETDSTAEPVSESLSTTDEATADEATADETKTPTAATEKATEAPAEKATTESKTSDTGSSGNDSTTKLAQQDEVYNTANVTTDGMIDTADLFTDRDLRQTADLSDATYYSVKDGEDITITSAGVYVISGSANNASVIVNAGDDDKVQLVLNGVSISNSSTPAIYVKSADKVFVTTVQGTTSSLSVTGSFSADGTTNTDAAIFSKDDLVLNGLGTLNISSTGNGVTSKDDLKITGGTISVNCTSDAFEANDSIAVADGSITVKSNKDGLHAENEEGNSVGYIYICGGSFNITANSDGIQATTVTQIDDGTFNITAAEGVEATYVQINGGMIKISASDDGINATSKSNAYNVTVEINGGDITVNMGQGDTDGIDSNGDLYVNGGTLNINCNSPFDYDGQGKYNGGTIYVNGSQTTELTNQMMGGGMGGDPGMGNNQGMGGNMGGNSGMSGGPGR